MAEPGAPEYEDPFKDNAFYKLLDRINDFGRDIGMWMILLTILAISCHVVMRYFFHAPINWAVDICMLFLLYITLFGSPWLLREDGHVGLDFFKDRLKGKPRVYEIMEIINNAIGALLCLVIVFFGIIETISVIQGRIVVDVPLSPPKWIVVVVIPITFLLMFFEFFRKVAIHYRAVKNLVKQK